MASAVVRPVSSDLCPACGCGLVGLIADVEDDAPALRAYCSDCDWQTVRPAVDARRERRCRLRTSRSV